MLSESKFQKGNTTYCRPCNRPRVICVCPKKSGEQEEENDDIDDVLFTEKRKESDLDKPLIEILENKFGKDNLQAQFGALVLSIREHNNSFLPLYSEIKYKPMSIKIDISDEEMAKSVFGQNSNTAKKLKLV